MAFDNVVFPVVPLIHDLQRTTIDPVQVFSNGTYEYRVRRQRQEKFSWAIPGQTMSNEQKESVRTFLQERLSGSNTFPYIDPELSYMTDGLMTHYSGTQFYFNLPNGANAGTHPLFTSDFSSLTVTVDGGLPIAPTSTGVVNNTIPVIDVPGTNAGSVVRVSGTVYFVVRLDSAFNETILALDCTNTPTYHSVSPIRLMEVYGEF